MSRVCGFVSLYPINTYLLLVQISGNMEQTQFYLNKICLRHLDEIQITSKLFMIFSLVCMEPKSKLHFDAIINEGCGWFKSR